MCGQAQRPEGKTVIEGQLYIARADRETVRLSAVTIRFVDRAAAKDVIEKVEELKKKTTEAIDREVDLNRKLRALTAGLQAMRPEERAIATKTMATLKVLVASNAPYADGKLHVSSYADILRASPWPAIATAETDAEGNFRLVVPKSDLTIVAMTSRTTSSGRIENYLWILPARFGEKNLLNNNNLYDEERN
jgi:hypothetical protein